MIDKALGTAIVAIIILGALSGVFYYTNLTTKPKEIMTEQTKITATICINFQGIGNKTNLNYTITTRNNTVYGFLLEAAKPDHGNFTVKATYWGSFDSMLVESIDDIDNGRENRYWQYLVNGVYAMVGCDKYIIQNNDYIEWKFEGFA